MGWKRTPFFSPYTSQAVFPGRIATMALPAWAAFAVAYAVFLVPSLRALLLVDDARRSDEPKGPAKPK